MEAPDNEEILDPLSAQKQKALFTLPSPLPDVRIVVINHVFSIHLVATTLMIMVSAVPYFYLRHDHMTAVIPHPSAHWIIMGILLLLSCVCLFLVDFFRHLRSYYWIYVTLVCALLFFSLAAGLLARHLGNLFVFQALSLAWVQSLAILLYASLSPRYMNLGLSFLYMCCFSCIAWSFSVYAFIMDGEWLGAAILGPIGLIMAIYHLLFIRYTAVAVYDVSWQKLAMAVADFYTFVFSLSAFGGEGKDKE